MLQYISVALLLRAGLGFVLLYAAFSSFVDPLNWIGFFPGFLFRLGIPEELVLGGFSLYQAALGLWLLFGKKIIYPALLSALTFFGIIVFNLGTLDIVFRDIGLFFAALALIKLEKSHD